MTISGWVRLDRWMRALHLYTSMLLVPWMLVYAISGFCVNHNEWFGEKLQLQPKWKVLQELDFEPNVEFPQNDSEQAQAILKRLKLEGAYQIAGDDPSQLVIYRYCATGLYRINWQRQTSRLVVQKQLPCSFYSFVNALHFQRGYYPPTRASLPWLIWGIVVDAVTTSTVLWVITGIYLWARRPRRRLWGGLCLGVGIVLFTVLAILMSR